MLLNKKERGLAPFYPYGEALESPCIRIKEGKSTPVWVRD